jgi:hypothetical protein
MDNPDANSETVKDSIITSMAVMACNLTRNLGQKFILVLDAFFAAGPAFLAIKGLVEAQLQETTASGHHGQGQYGCLRGP